MNICKPLTLQRATWSNMIWNVMACAGLTTSPLKPQIRVFLSPVPAQCLRQWIASTNFAPQILGSYPWQGGKAFKTGPTEVLCWHPIALEASAFPVPRAILSPAGPPSPWNLKSTGQIISEMLETQVDHSMNLHGPWCSDAGMTHGLANNWNGPKYGHVQRIMKHVERSSNEGDAKPVCKSTGSPRCSSIGSAHDLNRHIGLEVNVLIWNWPRLKQILKWSRLMKGRQSCATERFSSSGWCFLPTNLEPTRVAVRRLFTCKHIQTISCTLGH